MNGRRSGAVGRHARAVQGTEPLLAGGMHHSLVAIPEIPENTSSTFPLKIQWGSVCQQCLIPVTLGSANGEKFHTKCERRRQRVAAMVTIADIITDHVSVKLVSCIIATSLLGPSGTACRATTNAGA